MAASGAVSSPDVLGGIANLVDKSLVSADVDSAVARYRLLDTTAAYARKQLVDHGEFEQLARCHADFYLRLLEREHAEATLQRSADASIAYGSHIDNVRTALDWAFSLSGDPRYRREPHKRRCFVVAALVANGRVSPGRKPGARTCQVWLDRDEVSGNAASNRAWRGVVFHRTRTGIRDCLDQGFGNRRGALRHGLSLTRTLGGFGWCASRAASSEADY